MKFTLALIATVAFAQEHTHTADGQEIIGEYEIVTTTTTVEHVDIGAGETTCTNCVYNDYVLVYNSELIEEWAYGIKAEYD